MQKIRKWLNKFLYNIRDYHFRGIFWKNFFAILVSFAIPCVLIVTLLLYYYGYIQKTESELYSKEMTSKITTHINSVFDELCNKAIMLSMDSDVELFCYIEDMEDSRFYDVSNVLDFLALYDVGSELIDSIYIYSKENNGVISENGRYKYEYFYDKECLERWEHQEQQWQVEYIERSVNNKAYNTVTLFYSNPYGENYSSVIAFNIDVTKLKKELDYGENIEIEIADESEPIFFSDLEKYENKERLIFQNKKNLSNVIVHSEKMKLNNMDMTLYVDTSFLATELCSIRVAVVFVICMIIFLSLIIVVYLSQIIYSPLEDILQILNYRDSIYDIEKNAGNKKDESDFIIESIFKSIKNNEDIETELKQRIILLKRYQLIALQSQINPHFIYNTLNAINWLVLEQIGNKNDISKMIQYFSELIRSSIDEVDTFVSLKEEIEYCKKYLFIQKIKNNCKFNVRWNVPEQFLKCKMIKLLLQPIVENAIIHGGGQNEDFGIICINVTCEENILFIEVYDDGIGIPMDKILQIQKSMEQTTVKENSHLGLRNVNQRIRLMFGDEYGIDISSTLYKGTSVTIKIPYIKD